MAGPGRVLTRGRSPKPPSERVDLHLGEHLDTRGVRVEGLLPEQIALGGIERHQPIEVKPPSTLGTARERAAASSTGLATSARKFAYEGTPLEKSNKSEGGVWSLIAAAPSLALRAGDHLAQAARKPAMQVIGPMFLVLGAVGLVYGVDIGVGEAVSTISGEAGGTPISWPWLVLGSFGLGSLFSLSGEADTHPPEAAADLRTITRTPLPKTAEVRRITTPPERGRNILSGDFLQIDPAKLSGPQFLEIMEELFTRFNELIFLTSVHLGQIRKVSQERRSPFVPDELRDQLAAILRQIRRYSDLVNELSEYVPSEYRDAFYTLKAIYRNRYVDPIIKHLREIGWNTPYIIPSDLYLRIDTVTGFGNEITRIYMLPNGEMIPFKAHPALDLISKRVLDFFTHRAIEAREELSKPQIIITTPTKRPPFTKYPELEEIFGAHGIRAQIIETYLRILGWSVDIRINGNIATTVITFDNRSLTPPDRRSDTPSLPTPPVRTPPVR
jgi:hypothetical protein